MSIIKEIETIVSQHVPELARHAILDALKSGDEAITKMKSINEELSSLKNSLTAKDNEFRALESKYHAVSSDLNTLRQRELQLQAREIRCNLNEVKIEALTERIKDLKEVTLAVFANNHFKYSGQCFTNTSVGQGYTSASKNLTEEGTI